MKEYKCHVCGSPTILEPCNDCGVRCCGRCDLAHGKIAVGHFTKGNDAFIIEIMQDKEAGVLFRQVPKGQHNLDNIT